ncbi:MAG: SEC-C metal-binding domain-containing protein [Desulfobacterales bacterium]
MDWSRIEKNIDMKEPLLAEWVTERIKDKKETDPEEARRLEERFLDDDTLEYLIRGGDILSLSQLFQTVSPQRFAAHTDLMTLKWLEDWEDTTAGWALPVLLRTAPETGARLLEDLCKDREKLFDAYRIWGSLKENFSLLPEEKQKSLAFTIIEAYRETYGDKGIEEPYGTDVLKLAMQYDHPETEALFRHCLFSHDEEYDLRIYRAVKALGLNADEYQIIRDRMEDNKNPLYSKGYYREPLPDDLEKVIAKTGKRSFKHADSFFETHRGHIRDEKIRTLFENLLADRDFMKKLHEKKQKPYVYAMLLSGITTFFRAEKLNLTGLSVQDVAAMLCDDLEFLPDVEGVVSFFRQSDRAETIDCLTKGLEKSFEYQGSTINIVNVMGQLGYEEFLRPLCSAMETDWDFVIEAAEKALLKYGKKAVVFLADYLDQMDDMAKISAVEIVRKIGGTEAIAFTDRHFDSLMRIEPEFILHACESLCNENCLEKISSKVGKNQHLIDDTWLTITLLTKGKTPETEKLLKQYYRRRKEQGEMSEAIMSGRIADTARPYLDAELECKNCGDRSMYRICRVLMGEKGKPHIAQEIECINCNTLADFEFTEKGMMALSAETMRLMFAGESGTKEDMKEAYEKSPFQYGKTMAMGKVMEIDEAIEKYQKAIEKNPKDAEKCIGLGNIYYFMDLFAKAADLYQRAAEANPQYIQSYYSLAQIAEKKQDAHAALEWMEKGLPFLEKAKYYQGSGGQTKEDLLDAYCEYYNSLLDETGSDKPQISPPGGFSYREEYEPVQPVRREKKIGRNDPCPCGSGKKYKKCCLMKEKKD